MVPVHIDIGHYRALRNIAVPLADYTALVGPNGVGKSTVLDALDFFLERDRDAEDDDVQRGGDDPVCVTVTFSGLTEDERVTYAEGLTESGDLVVTKVCAPGEGSRYEVAGMRHPGFDDLREVHETGSKSEFNSAMRAFAAENRTKYDLSPKRSAEENLAELRRWESENLAECIEGPVVFPFRDATKDQLIPSLRAVYVPAVQEASATLEGAKSPLTQMLRALVYPRFEEDPKLNKLRAHVESEYRKLFPPEGTPELTALAERVSAALNAFCPGAEVRLGWAEDVPELSIPPVLPEVIEDGVPTDVDHKGHGLQRALIIAMLQAEDEHRRSTSGSAAGESHVVLMIEEPELYQHPSQCRHFRRVLSSLSSEGNLRVIVTTHSPDFISLDAIDAIRIMRREPVAGKIPARKIATVTLGAIAKRYSTVIGREFDLAHLERRLHVVDDIMREAFFANAVVLVEGVGDQGLLSAQCAIDGVDLEGKGCVVIPCHGKDNMPLAICILDMLGIKYYAVFDADTHSEQNKPILRALGVPDSDLPKTKAPDTAVLQKYAVVKPKIEDAVRAEFGAAAFDDATKAVAAEYGRDDDQALKNPTTAREVLKMLRDGGKSSRLLQDIAKTIGGLT